MAGLGAWFDAANEGAEEACDTEPLPYDLPAKEPAVQIFLGKAGDAAAGLYVKRSTNGPVAMITNHAVPLDGIDIGSDWRLPERHRHCQLPAGKDYNGEREQGVTLARCRWTGQVALVLCPAVDDEGACMDAANLPGGESCMLFSRDSSDEAVDPCLRELAPCHAS